jgi:hypothetical protein
MQSITITLRKVINSIANALRATGRGGGRHAPREQAVGLARREGVPDAVHGARRLGQRHTPELEEHAPARAALPSRRRHGLRPSLRWRAE